MVIEILFPHLTTCSVMEPLAFESLVFNADNWYVAQDIVVNAIDDDVILESPYGSLLNVVDLGELAAVNITLLVSEMDAGMYTVLQATHCKLTLARACTGRMFCTGLSKCMLSL